jgi:predicted transcriptional regulator
MHEAISRDHPGADLRTARQRLGISRARLSAMADCSIATLAVIEQGYRPKRSEALERAWEVLDELAQPDDAPKRVPA